MLMWACRLTWRHRGGHVTTTTRATPPSSLLSLESTPLKVCVLDMCHEEGGEGRGGEGRGGEGRGGEGREGGRGGEGTEIAYMYSLCSDDKLTPLSLSRVCQLIIQHMESSIKGNKSHFRNSNVTSCNHYLTIASLTKCYRHNC